MHDSFRVRSRAIIIDNEELFVVKHAHTNDYFVLPGGHLDDGENIQNCMTRELEEELGITPEVGPLVAVYSFKDARRENQQYIEFYFLIENATLYRNHENEVKSHAHEISEARWVAKEEDVNVLPQKIHTLWKTNELLNGQVHFVDDL